MVSRHFVIWILNLFLLFACAQANALPEPSHNVQNKIRQTLVVAVSQAPPYSMQDEDGNWSGITVDLWREIARQLKVNYEFKRFEKVTDLMKGLQSGSVDLAATGLSITSERQKMCDFSEPYLASSEAIAVNADQQSNIFRVVRSTFLNWTFLLLVLGVVGLAVCGALILWLLEHKSDSEHYSGKTMKSFAKSLFWSTMVMAGREFPKAVGWSVVSPTTFAGRLFAMFWMILGVVLVSVLTAAAASVFTSKEIQAPFAVPTTCTM